MKKTFLFVLAVSSALLSFAQDSTKPASKKELKKIKIAEVSKQEEEGVIKYTRHVLGGVRLNTDGYGAFIEIGRAKSLKKSLLFQFSIDEKKHVKEDKFFDQSVTLEPILYGKINYFYPVKLGVQQQFLLGNKGNRNGVYITGNIGGGPIIGLLRPYKLLVDKNGTKTYVGYDSPDSSLFLNGPFYAAPGFGTGWSDLKVTPGFYIKPAIRFDYGKYNETISAIEVGMTAEYYSKNIPQMVFNKERKFFLSAYASILFGRRKR